MRDAFRSLGHDAVSCDLLPTDVEGPHYQGDVFDIIGEGWDLAVFHPPCTYLCNSGVRWLYEKPGRWAQMEEGARFFRRLLDCKSIPRFTLENPRIHKHALPIIGRRADCVVQPWMFGDFATKATGFWMQNLPPLVPMYATKDACREALGLPPDAKPSDACHKAPPSADRWKIRSTTYAGIAAALADQLSRACLQENP